MLSSGMSDDQTYPYTLEVTPSEKPAGHFRWAIRQHGKLLQRSDRSHPSEEAARKNGLAEIERKLRGGDERR
jgi:hypothetical protein